MESEKYQYIWRASFKDGSVLNQFNSEERVDLNENKYQQVLDRQQDLKTLSIIHVDTKLTFIIDLEHGLISLTHLDVPPIELNEDEQHKKEYDYRPIFFRKRSVDINLDLSIEENNKQKIKILWYTFGFQYLDENNKNHKRLVKLFNDGRFVIY